MRASSPYQRNLSPCSRHIHELMDEEDARYVKATPPVAEPTRGPPQTPVLRSVVVRETYAREALKRLAKNLTAGSRETNAHDNAIFDQMNEILHPKTAAPARKKFDKRWYHFYNRQVYSIGMDVATPQLAPPSVVTAPLRRTTTHKRLSSVQSAGGLTAGCCEDNDASDEDESGINSLKQKTPPWTACPANDQVYFDCFDIDWAACGIEKIVRDAVERQRIYTLLRAHARILFHLFRLHASIQGANDREPFKLAAKAKFFEDLSVAIPEPGRHGITDQPTTRPGFLYFIVQLALGYYKRDEIAGLLKRLATEGLEVSSSVYYLVHEFLLPFASIEDPHHFVNLFFNHAATSAIFLSHRAGLEIIFLQHAERITHDPSTSTAPRETSELLQPYLKFHSYLVLLHQYKQIDAKFSESRASTIFCSCLPVWPDDNAVISRALDYHSFTVALAKIVFAKHEKAICSGDDDVCPERPSSDRCTCEFGAVKDKYNMQAFLDPLYATVFKIASPGLKRGPRRRSIVGDIHSTAPHTPVADRATSPTSTKT
ncbi:hypothetical protein ACHHYP_05010 [Achlya hypogyna]|uniref:Uncharacterized protein n=1 Tax=Achlya hypogyna TaxID=1202772 RepID=A0A1V9YZG6_ACHHY|nr:hypothetical protein ACHHYP_05010 [Achlya hypogyna]